MSLYSMSGTELGQKVLGYLKKGSDCLCNIAENLNEKGGAVDNTLNELTKGGLTTKTERIHPSPCKGYLVITYYSLCQDQK